MKRAALVISCAVTALNAGGLVWNLASHHWALAGVSAIGLAVGVVTMRNLFALQRRRSVAIDLAAGPSVSSVTITSPGMGYTSHTSAPLFPPNSSLRAMQAQQLAQLSRSGFMTSALQASKSQHAAMLQALYVPMSSMSYDKLRAMIEEPQSSTVFYAINGLKTIAAALLRMPDPALPTTLGLRSWVFDIAEGYLRSPVRHTIWRDAELRCDQWNESEVVRGVAGIHAHLVTHNWRETAATSGLFDPTQIIGVVERFGRYVLGTEGWRCEWAVIRQLHAPNRFVAAALREAYPEVEVTFATPNQESTPCK